MEGPNGATAHSVAHFSIRESYLTPLLVGCSGGGPDGRCQRIVAQAVTRPRSLILEIPAVHRENGCMRIGFIEEQGVRLLLLDFSRMTESAATLALIAE